MNSPGLQLLAELLLLLLAVVVVADLARSPRHVDCRSCSRQELYRENQMRNKLESCALQSIEHMLVVCD